MAVQYNLSHIASLTEGQLHGGALASATTQPQVSILLTDSRSLTFAAHTLFFALVTSKGDGHQYIPQLYEHGVRAFVVSRSWEDLGKLCPEAWFLVVRDPLTALQRLAAHHRRLFPKLPVVGITGSNGKTTVKEWLYQMLHDTRRIVRSPRSYNSQVGVPLSVWQLEEGADLALFEAGISRPDEMARLEPIIAPNIGILTNIGDAHQENFSSRLQKLTEKLLLFKNCDVVIYNADIPDIAEAMEMAGIAARSMAWTLKHEDAQIEVLSTRTDERTTTVRYLFMGLDGEFTLPFTDEAGLENAMNCLAVMLYLGVPREEIHRRLGRLEAIAMRMEVVEGVRGCLLINDAYNADLTSLTTSLDFQKRRSSTQLRSALILTDMDEVGLAPDELTQRVAELCQVYSLHRLITVGPMLAAHRTLLEGVVDEFSAYDSTEQLLLSPELTHLSNELILLKGARRFRLEQVSDLLQLRRHETILEVDLDAIAHNLECYRARLKPETKLVCMVKAFGYGNGSYELAKTLQDRHVDYLAVAVADEGAELRRQGIRVPIMVMNPEMSAFRVIIDNHLEPEIYSFRLLEAFAREVDRQGVTRYPIHIKIDSGMHRLGFQPHEVSALIEQLRSHESLRPASIFSHLAGADSREFDDFTLEQLRRFTEASSAICAAFPYKILRHILNSAGMERFPQYQFDMCRLGIGLYGFEASDERLGLAHVSTLKSTLLQIKEVAPDETVGYSRRGRLQRPTRIAMVPIGYADGYDRRLGNGNAFMLLHGHRCPTVGNVCMDVTFLDVTDCPMAAEGDEVIIWGPEHPISDLSDTLGTIVYEVMSTLGTRVKRVYTKE
jgi:alanine racemase